MSFPGTQSPPSALSTPTPTLSAPGPTPQLQYQLQTQIITNDNANTIGNNMHLPPTPPADYSPPKSASNTNKRGGGEQAPGTTGSAAAVVGKFGSAMLHLPSFASVLSSPSPSYSHSPSSSSSSSASGTKPPLAPATAMTAIHSRSSAKAKATSVQHQQQIQEHKREHGHGHGQGQGQGSSPPLALLSPNVSMATATASPSPASPSSPSPSSITNRDEGLGGGVSRSAAVGSSAVSPCSSHSDYQSPLGSPRVVSPAADQSFKPNFKQDNDTHLSRRTSGDGGKAQEPVDDSESSDVEIYLNHDSASRMHVHVLQDPSNASVQQLESLSGTHFPAHQGFMPPPTLEPSSSFGLGAPRSNDNPSNPTSTTTPKRLSPLPLSLPIASNLSQQPHGQMKGTSIGQAKSPQVPPHAPVHSTIPLPEVDACEHEYQQYQKKQQQHRQALVSQTQSHTLSHTSPSSTIDLTGLAVGHTQQQQQQGLSIAASQSLPATTDFTPSSTIDLSGSIHNPHAAHNSDINMNGDGFGLASSVSEMTLQGQKTPNVYINGLPPHFPEDQLFALAAPFGDIRSVRTFTRHVRDSESGYGFVLFETIEAAEKCIISLRRYRNLHPTFSKQIHKIPGTAYASIPASGSSVSSWDGQSSMEGAEGGSLGPDASFKAKMENLHDPSSTNLYMEGLPLSIDEPTLSALVTPHRISSSRFFQTRLSNPPRIIAFVRLETRAGAEEVIERLHGRMVRGWNDSGSRISVRFADTSEQRELRRTERSTQEGECSPARLTIAQAALLNLRGHDLRPPKSGPVIHAHSAVPGPIGRFPSAASARGFTTSVSAPDFSSNASHHPHPPIISSGGLEVDYSLAPGQGAISGHSSRNRSPAGYSYQALPDPYQMAPAPAHASSMDPTMAALLNSLQGNEMPYNAASDYPQTLRNPGFNQAVGGRLQGLSASQSMGSMGYPRPPPAFTRSGYTATEEYIMRAHAESAALAQAQVQHQQLQQQAAERRRPAPLDLRRGRGEDQDLAGNGQEENGANIAVGVRGYRTQASIGRVGQGQGFMSPPASSVSMPSLASLAAASPMMGGMSSSMSLSEDDFHASAAAVRQQFRSLGVGGDDREEGVGDASQRGHHPHIHPAHANARLSGDPGPSGLPSQSQTQYQSQIQRPLPLSPLMPSSNEDPNSNMTSGGNRMVNYQQAHMRSTTLPHHRSSAGQAHQSQPQTQHGRGHYQHSSMSIPAPSLRTPQHASAGVMSGRTLDVSGMGDGAIYEGEQQEQQGSVGGCSHGAQLSSNAHHHTHAHANGQQQQNQNQSQQQNQPSSHNAKAHYSPTIFGDIDSASGSPSLISPTLTYSSQTPSTLSPATPFFGSFNSQAEGFERAGMEQGQGLKKGSSLRSGTHTQPQTQGQAQ